MEKTESNLDNILWETMCYEDGCAVRKVKKLVTEIEYRLILNGRLFKELCCSSWQLEELAVGILYMHHVITCMEDIKEIRVDNECHDIYVETALVVKRKCVEMQCENVAGKQLQVTPDRVVELAQQLEKGSKRFHLTGGVHSAALAEDGEIVLFMEDVGRHNAMDKLMGACLMQHIDPRNKVIVFSGRVASEIMEKAVAIGSRMLIAMSAPTERSCTLARNAEITLIGFARGNTFNVYTHSERVDFTAAHANCADEKHA